MYKKILSIALKGIAVAMGVAVIVLNALSTLSIESAFPMLGINLTALAFEAFQKE